ncbi:MAG: hypothetical protein ABIM89_10975 [Mycobacteriales bacterium]
MTGKRFTFEFMPAARPLLLLWGVTAASAYVEVTETELRARFGFLSMATPLSNVAGAEETGPYKVYRALGPRLSLTDKGATFGTSTRGVCIRFHDPVRVLFPSAIHPGLTVTVADRPGLVAALQQQGQHSSAG